ncbi:MAG: TraR/DksA family transcriptional regulator [Acetobacterales bacterium]
MNGRTDIDIEKFRKLLLEERAELLADDRAHEHDRDPVGPDSSLGPQSRMDAMQQAEMARAMHERHGVRLRQIDAALQRIEEGEYGYCVQTGEPIEIERLRADPATALSVEAARQNETRRRPT